MVGESGGVESWLEELQLCSSGPADLVTGRGRGGGGAGAGRDGVAGCFPARFSEKNRKSKNCQSF